MQNGSTPEEVIVQANLRKIIEKTELLQSMRDNNREILLNEAIASRKWVEGWFVKQALPDPVTEFEKEIEELSKCMDLARRLDNLREREYILSSKEKGTRFLELIRERKEIIEERQLPVDYGWMAVEFLTDNVYTPIGNALKLADSFLVNLSSGIVMEKKEKTD